MFAITLAANADTFGSGGNSFEMDFVTVGNPGNANDAGAGGGIYASSYGGVDYIFRMGAYEVSQDMITKATNLGMTNVTAGAWTGDMPATSMTWYEAAAFVNWLNTSTGHQAAYNLSYNGSWSMNLWSSEQAWQLGGQNLFRNKDAYYFLPSDDEWYKAAYHQNDGVTANYWDFAAGSNSIPNGINYVGDPDFDAVFLQPQSNGRPNVVTDVGTASPYGTYGQNGNVWEWNESGITGPNDAGSEPRVFRGGAWDCSPYYLTATYVDYDGPAATNPSVGLRVASVPEPSASLLILGAGLFTAMRRARGAGLRR